LPLVKFNLRLALVLACLSGASSSGLAQNLLAGFHGEVGIGYVQTNTSNNSDNTGYAVNPSVSAYNSLIGTEHLI
jgi:hypothetical protein